MSIVATRAAAAPPTAGPEIRINQTTTGEQTNPAVCIDSAGRFLVVWVGNDSNSTGVFGRRFDVDGQALSPEFSLNSYSSNPQEDPDIACDGSGAFVAVWASGSQDGSGKGVYARTFSSADTPVASGAEFVVNSVTDGHQEDPAIAGNLSQGFTITWESDHGDDGNGRGVYAQRYSAQATPIGSNFRVNNTTQGNQIDPDVAADDAGNVVFVWEGPSNGTVDIFARR